MNLTRNMWVFRLRGIKSNVENARKKFHRLLSDKERATFLNINTQLKALLADITKE